MMIPVTLEVLSKLKSTHSWQAIGELFGVGHHTVISWADKLGYAYTKRTPKARPETRKIIISDVELLAMYQSMSQVEIGIALGTNRANVQRRLAQLGAAVSWQEGQRKKFERDHIDLTPAQEDLILGTLLGDGCLAHTYEGGYALSIAHSEKQAEYVKHKRDILGGSKITTRYKTGFGSVSHRFTFCNAHELRRIANICLTDGKKVVTQDWLDRLTWRAIAYWYMDDGSLGISHSKTANSLTYASADLCTEGFTDAEVLLIQKFFAGKGFHFTTSTHKPRINSKKVPGLTLALNRGGEVTKFLRLLEPYIIPSMRYKVRCLDDVSFARFQSPQIHN